MPQGCLKMRLLLQVILVLTVTLGLLLIGTHLVAGRTSPLFATVFSLPDGSSCPTSCLFGVSPGKTPFDHISTILRQHPLSANSHIREEYGIVKADGAQFSFNALRDPEGATGAISVSFDSALSVTEALDGATVGYMLSHLGAPQRLQLARRNYRHVRLFYPQLGIVLSADANTSRLQASDPLSFIGFSTPAMFADAWRGILLTTVDWSGYRDLRQYILSAGYP